LRRDQLLKEKSMPLPTPNKGEDKNKFISRCMSNPQAKRDFPNQNQRVAVCNTQWRRKRKSIAERLKELKKKKGP